MLAKELEVMTEAAPMPEVMDAEIENLERQIEELSGEVPLEMNFLVEGPEILGEELLEEMIVELAEVSSRT